jgi:hypothetical protein
MSQSINTIKRRARKMLREAEKEKGLETRITLMMQKIGGIDGKANAWVIWSRDPDLRSAQLWIPGHPGYTTVYVKEPAP